MFDIHVGLPQGKPQNFGDWTGWTTSRLRRFIHWNTNPMGPCPDGAFKNKPNGFDGRDRRMHFLEQLRVQLCLETWWNLTTGGHLPVPSDSLFPACFCWPGGQDSATSLPSPTLGTHGQWEHELLGSQERPEENLPGPTKSWHSCNGNAGRTSNGWSIYIYLFIYIYLLIYLVIYLVIYLYLFIYIYIIIYILIYIHSLISSQTLHLQHDSRLSMVIRRSSHQGWSIFWGL